MIKNVNSIRYELRKKEEELCRLQYLIENLRNDSLTQEERVILLDGLLVKLHKVQTRRDALHDALEELC